MRVRGIEFDDSVVGRTSRTCGLTSCCMQPGHYEKDGSSGSEAGETHFRLEVISTKFAGMPFIKRHQLIYGLLDDEFKVGYGGGGCSQELPTTKVLHIQCLH